MRVNVLPFDFNIARDGSLNSRTSSRAGSDLNEANKIKTVVSTINKSSANAPAPPIVNGLGLGLEFSVDEATGQNIIRVLDIKSGKIVRQIPSDEVLAFIKRIKETKGIIVSRRL